jgi:hypothetical protein
MSQNYTIRMGKINIPSIYTMDGINFELWIAEEIKKVVFTNIEKKDKRTFYNLSIIQKPKSKING